LGRYEFLLRAEKRKAGEAQIELEASADNENQALVEEEAGTGSEFCERL
jgi:hypothetical protein